MKNSRHSSNTSPSCRLEWRPSRVLVGALVALTALAVASLLTSGAPAWLGYPAAMAAAWLGAGGARKHWKQPHMQLLFPRNDMPASVDGEVVSGMQVQWRGPLAFARWTRRDGVVWRVAWWPDTLPPALRRELRLAAPGGQAARRRR